MTAATDADLQSLRHLHALRNFIGNLVEQADKSGGCECHKPPSLLLVGPPGAGKTYLVKQMSKVCEMPLYGVHTHQVANADSIKKLFTQARDNYPSLVFLDDVENIFANHDRDHSCPPTIQHIREEIFMELGPRKLKIHDPQSEHNPTQQLVQDSPTSGGSRASSRSSSLSRPRPSAPELNDSYDESLYPDNNGIIVVAATNKPWQLYKDHELLSRFRGVYLVGLPDKPSRYTLLQALLRELHHTLTDQDIMDIAERTQGFTPADLMVVMKTLTYKQFSVLLNITNGQEGSHGNSTSASPTPTSSELTETGSDTDIDGLSEPKSKLRIPDVTVGEVGAPSVSSTAATLAAMAAASSLAGAHNGLPSRGSGVTNMPPSTMASTSSGKAGGSGGSSPLSGGEGLLSRVAAAGVTVAATGAVAATVAALQEDWTSDSEDEGGLVTQRERVPESGRDSVSADSGLVLTRSSEEVMARLGQQEHAASADDRPAEVYNDSSSRMYPSPDCSTLPLKEPTEEHHLKQSTPCDDSEDPESNTNFVNEKMVDVVRESDERQNSSASTAEPGNDTTNCSDQSIEDTLQDAVEETSVNGGEGHHNTSIGSSNGPDTGRVSPPLCSDEQQRQDNPPPTAPIPVFNSDTSYDDNNSPPSRYSPVPIPEQFDQVDNDRSIYDNVTRTDECNVPAGINADDGDDTFNNDDDDEEDDEDDDDENSLEDDEMHDYVLQDGDAVDATGCSETEEIVVHPECKDAPSANDTIEENDCEEQDAAKQEDVNVSNGPAAASDDRVVELHYSEPPEPMRDDNLAVDSDSDNESPVLRPRRVGFNTRPVAIDSMSGDSGSGGSNNNNNGGGERNIGFGGGRPSAMSPLSVDCGGNDLPPNISLDVMGGGAALNNGGGGSDNILRQLLARPAMANNNGGSPSPGCSPTPPASPAPSHCSSGAATIASSGSGRGTPQHMLHHHQDMHHSPLHQSPSLHHHKQQRGGPVHHSPLHHQQQSDDGDLSDHHHHQSPSTARGGNSVHMSPLHHQSPNMGGGGSVHHSPMHHQPHVQNGRGRDQRPRQQAPGVPLLQQESPDGRRRMHDNGDQGKQNGDMQKDRRDESESVSVKGVSGLGAAAAAAAATIAAAADGGPTMSKATEHDMEKLLNALEEHMDGTLPRAGTSNGDTSDGATTEEDETTTDEEDDEDDDDDDEHNKALDEIDVAGIQPITMDDVIEVLEKGYRSVSDEEIKQYTDFMVWFASVAKSACPHNNGNRSEAPTVDEDDFCVESTLCATPNLLKRNQRRRPLKKLGKFLLKALMFILD